MNRLEYAKFAMALKTYYPRESILPNEAAMDLWFIQLQDLDYKLAEAALNKWVATCRWSPTIADIREEAANISAGEIGDWADGWQQVQRAISRFGFYRPAEALESMDEITRKCVERLGFVNICTSDNMPADRANFRKIYEAYAEREKTERQIPAATKKQISQLQGEKVLIEGGGDG